MVMYGRYLKEVAVLLCALCMYNYTSGVEGSDNKPWKNVNTRNIFSVNVLYICDGYLDISLTTDLLLET